MTRKPTYYELYLESPQKCLDQFVKDAQDRSSLLRERVFINQSCEGLRDKTRYSSFRYVEHEELRGRKYDIEFWDGAPSIHWRDVLHDERRHRKVPMF